MDKRLAKRHKRQVARARETLMTAIPPCGYKTVYCNCPQCPTTPRRRPLCPDPP